ncbi:MAG: tetratricopeptide repeat protein [Opitutaceae bacterium]
MNLRWRLSQIRGYLALGMVRHAEKELEDMRPEHAELTEVKALQVAILQEKKNWPRLRQVAGELVKREPGDAGWWVTLAYATRRAVSLAAARRILLEAEKRHPAEAVIQFNLGCYACQLGDLKEARVRVDRAVELDANFKEARAHDPDLERLRGLE